MAGKTTSLYTRVYVDSADGTVRNITASINNIGGLGVTADQIDVSTFADTLKQYLNGLKDSNLTLAGPFNDTALAVSPSESGDIRYWPRWVARTPRPRSRLRSVRAPNRRAATPNGRGSTSSMSTLSAATWAI